MRILKTYTNHLNSYKLVECRYNFKYPTLWMIRSNEVELELCTFGIEDTKRVRVPIGYTNETVKS